MKILKQCIVMLLLAVAPMNSSLQAAVNYQVLPLPHAIQLLDGAPFELTSGVTVYYPKSNKAMQRNALYLSNYLQDVFGTKAVVKVGEAQKGIRLMLDSEIENPEGYTMTVDSKGVTIAGATEAGVFYGIQTLRKSLPLQVNKAVTLPAVKINDEPRFAYRGMMLDASRHFESIENVKKFIDMLVLHNVNRFHWHLTDDQGWRVEIKKYPRLTEIGSKRKETVIGRNSGVYDGIPHSGFYTGDELRDVVKYAQERYITIIPEIDLPGHMLGALAAYPELGCTGGPYEVWTKWGVSNDVLCIGNDKTLDLIEDVLTEIIRIFPSAYIHIGGDECPKTRWKDCPKCQARIQELGLVGDDHHSAEDRLQSFAITQAEKFLNKHNRKLIGWDEILEGGLAPNATVMSWRGMEGGIDAARLGHDVIMTPNSHLYFDHYQTKNTEHEPLAIGGYSPIEHVYKFNPMPSQLTPEQQKHILGVQANVWREYMQDFNHVQYMVLPRMAALAEVQWMQPEKKNYKEFLIRLLPLIEHYKYHGYNYAKHHFDMTLPTDSAIRIQPMPAAPVAEQGAEQGVSAATIVQTGSVVYVAGGCNFPDQPAAEGGTKRYYSRILEWNGREWCQAGRLRQPIAYGVAVSSTGGFIYIGGQNIKGSQNAVELYRFHESALSVIETMPSLPHPIDNMAGIQVAQRIYIAGGIEAGRASNSLYMLDLSVLESGWQLLSEFPGSPRVQPVLTATEKKGKLFLYLWGGYATGDDIQAPFVAADGLRYDVKENQWRSLLPPVDRRGKIVSLTGGTAALWNDSMTVFSGGVNSSVFLKALQDETFFQGTERASLRKKYLSREPEWYRFNTKLLLYNMNIDQWEEVLDAPELARAGAAAVRYNDELLTFQGELKPGVRSPESYLIRLPISVFQQQ